MFNKITIIGIGMIGSSIARVIKREKLAKNLTAYDSNRDYLRKALELGIVDEINEDVVEAVKDAELIMYCSPVGTYSDITKNIMPFLKEGTIITDVGSVKKCAIRDIEKYISDDSGVILVAGHPVAGIEKSGPEVGFAEMFEDRWFIITPSARSTEEAITQVSNLWSKAKMKVDIMTPKHHDKVMAAVSHLPHLIAFSIVGTVADLEGYEQQEIIKYSASGFRDFTRIAGSDPTMWRDIFLNNKETILELIQRFVEDLIALQRNIRWNEGDELFRLFSRTQKIRKEVIEAKQHQMEEEKRLSHK
ncbi:MAG: prephenate dehydrogenase/arogenate dehydrogenase family protein [Alphaproteobacteria bacterium]